MKKITLVLIILAASWLKIHYYWTDRIMSELAVGTVVVAVFLLGREFGLGNPKELAGWKKGYRTLFVMTSTRVNGLPPESEVGVIGKPGKLPKWVIARSGMIPKVPGDPHPA